MAYNGAGVFSLVSGNPVVTGTVISSTWANNTLSDIANNGLTNCLTKDGQQTPTANIPMGGFKITGLANGTNPQDAATFAQTGARLINIQRFVTSGTYTNTTGTNFVIVECIAAGGAGGGAPATGAGAFSLGGGGGGGGYTRSKLTSGFTGGVSITVGTGGVGVSGTTGGAGGATSFGALVVTTGGAGGSPAGPSATGFLAQPGAGGTRAGSGDFTASGNSGSPGLSFNSVVIGGNGGTGFYGGGAFGAANNNGANGAGAGAAGGGSSNLSSASARAGGSGDNGICIVYEYS